MSQFSIDEPATGIFRLGTTYCSYYLIEEGGRYTVVDSGLPGYWDQLESFLASRGVDFADIEAQVLTHHHLDHRGNTNRIRSKSGAGVRIHHADHAALTRKPPPPKIPMWRPRVFRYGIHLLRHGLPRVGDVVDVSTYGDDEVLDVPGRPRVIHAPGHTPGNCSLLLESPRALLTGDTLTGQNLITGVVGPHLAPGVTNDDSEEALTSLERLEGLEVNLLLTVHGPIWRGPISEAVAIARRHGIY